MSSMPRPYSSASHPRQDTRGPWRGFAGGDFTHPTEHKPMVIDIIGCHREVTVCGHIELLRRLPIRHRNHLQLMETYSREPGNYEGRHSEYYDSHAKLLDYGHGYIALRLYDDITRPELGEFLLGKGWKMIGFAANKDGNKTIITEKWCNIRDH
ncbi:unnamed protein product [Owenia fusiformis]|uniref:Uncharacterized protein n=1 Tax=Owenia fusiformis TaxID=6347 RepID=A0A8J1Y0S3_OWEFU|nr:unnamed protein product [Owenia fusiformis]